MGWEDLFISLNVKDTDPCSYVSDKCSRREETVGAGESGGDN